VLANADILWDQTNLTKKSRKGKLLQVPPHYTKVAVFFSIPNLEELQRRLDSRAGKTIPRHVVADMIKSLEEPSLEEGFDLIVKV
jgi:predicted kinase